MVDMTQRLAELTPAQRKLLKARLKNQSQGNEPIAIVGMSCRLPGADNLAAFWEMIRDGHQAFREMDPRRWDVERLYDSNPDTPARMSTKWFATLDEIGDFDCKFFGITPREAGKMDVQQRLLLETAWRAMEHAGIPADRLAGSNTGVFVGIGATDYSKMAAQRDDFYELFDVHVGTGNALSIAANRISYIFDFRGPSLAIDTACSSGLVCVHQAIESLRRGECDIALTGAVNAILSPETTIAFSKARMLSPTGQCRPFDAAADGYVRGEGAGMVMLKRLSDATRDGDRVLAVIRGSAVNQDGRTSGITAPNALSQQSCVRAAAADGSVDLTQVSYVEAHGTGTPLGDPIESQSLTKLFPQTSPRDRPCYVTSVKANIGHTETLSGIASLIKVVLMLNERTIPRQTGLTALNPNIRLEGSRVVINEENRPWEGPLVAGVNSFGFGGTNSHVLLEAAPAAAPAAAATSDRPKHILAVSSKSKEALPELAAAYAAQLESLPADRLGDFCAATTTTRVHFEHRAAMAVDAPEKALKMLSALAEDKRAAGMKRGHVQLTARPKIAFLFTGQGSQYPGMGKSLYETQPLFRETIDRCHEALRPHREHALKHVMFEDQTGLVNQTGYTQPALFALEYALAEVWRSWGVHPNLVMGHSIGEYVAACLAGVFSVEDGLALVAKRAELMQQMPPNGKMAVVFATRDRVEKIIAELGERIVVATANGPENNVISGDNELVDQALAACKAAGLGTQELRVSHAFHSPLMDPMLDEFEAFAATLTYNRPQIPIVANRTGEIAESMSFDAAYWRDHLRNCVEFEASIQAAAADGIHAFVEIGPTASLLGMGKRCVPDCDAVWAPSLRKGRGDWDTLLASVADSACVRSHY